MNSSPLVEKLSLKGIKKPSCSLTLLEQGLEIKLENGAAIRFDLDGNIELSPALNKTVTVKGNLTVEKEITGKLSSTMKQELIQEIKQSLNK